MAYLKPITVTMSPACSCSPNVIVLPDRLHTPAFCITPHTLRTRTAEIVPAGRVTVVDAASSVISTVRIASLIVAATLDLVAYLPSDSALVYDAPLAARPLRASEMICAFVERCVFAKRWLCTYVCSFKHYVTALAVNR